LDRERLKDFFLAEHDQSGQEVEFDKLFGPCAGVHEETLNHIGKRFSQGPPNAPDFKIHRAMERILKVGPCVGQF
jgi:hypothetical protein